MSLEGTLPIDSEIVFDQYCSIDLSEGNSDLNLFDISSSSAWENYIESVLTKNKAKVAYGGYLEVRNLYDRSDYFQSISEDDKRNIHLGIDFWCKAGTNVCAFQDGQVHSFATNKNYGDYGPTIILEHKIGKEKLYSLYGHLSKKSLENLRIGQKIQKGQNFAKLGTSEINGDYAPHLHFQVIKDLQGKFGDYPGVSSKKNLDFFKMNCPDPLSLIQKNA
ncbi:MAG: peptidoglycan DD-metalloendopeptidase family protein [Polaribacter sp.]